MLKLASKFTKFALLLIIALLVYFFFIKEPSESTSSNESDSLVLVERVIDGDTFVLPDGMKVRLLGIDAPERYDSGKMDNDAERSGQSKETIAILGKRSTDFLKKLIENKKVRLVPEENYEDKDKYGRLLRYIYLEDGTFVNGFLVEEGYAQVYRKFDLSKKDKLLELEQDARENKRGLWGDVDGTKQFTK